MRVKVLTKDQINLIQNKSLEILENIGISIPHEEILSRFIKYGAEVDKKKQLVKIPHELVKEFISKATKRFTLYGRDLSEKAEFGIGKRNYNTTAGEAFWLENIGDERRYATMKDVVKAVKFTDVLDQINIIGAMSDPHELPVYWRSVAVASEMIRYTNKPIYFWFFDRASAKYLVDILITLRGDENKATKYPMFFPLLEPVSPLSFPFNGIDLLFETARVNMPVPIGPMAQMGMSSPSTIAGTLAQENAEVLAGVCITQLIREGMPVCYGGICHAFDMKTVQMIFSGPEQAIFSVAMTQLGKSYGFPVYINAGLTDSKLPDAQAGLESGLTLMLGVAAGADVFGHMGICGVDQASSLDMLVMQSEIISYVESVARILSFKDDDLALDIINDVGPKGSFLGTNHTRKHFRSELWFPTLLDRHYFNTWKDKGARNIEKVCKDRKADILSKYEPKPIDNDLNREINNIVEAAKQNLKQK